MDSKYYDAYWSQRDAPPDCDPTTPQRQRKLERALASLPAGAKVLDLGCGRGSFTRFLKDKGYAAAGVDISDAAVRRARDEQPGLPFDVMTADQTLPHEDAAFDAVWSSEVIEHVFDVHGHLCEVNRVLKPGGLLVTTTPYHGVVKNVLIAMTGFDRHFDPEISHVRFFDRRGLTRCLRRAGFEPVSWSGVGRCWPLFRTWFVVAEKRSAPQAPPPIRG